MKRCSSRRRQAVATNIGTLAVYLKTDTKQYRKGLRQAQKDTRKFQKRISVLANVGMVAVAAGIGFAARSFIDFDSAMNQSLAITKQVSPQIRSELEKTAQTISNQSMTSAADLARGYFFLISAGKDLAQSQKLLSTVNEFATAGMFDLSTATTLAADAQKALGLASDDSAQDIRGMTRVTDNLVKANTLANASVEEFATALTSDSAAAMRAANIEIEEGVAVLAAYAEQGVKGAKAGAMLGRFLRLVVPAARDNAEAYKALGVDVFDATGNMRNMADIVQDLEGALNGLSVREKSAALELLGFEKRTQQVVTPLLGMSKNIRKFENELDLAGGTTKRVSDNQLKSFEGRLKTLKNNLINGTNEALNMKGSIMTLGNAVNDNLKLFNSFDQAQKRNIKTVFKWGVTLGIASKAMSMLGLKGAISALGFHTVAMAKNSISTGINTLGTIANYKAIAARSKFSLLDIIVIKAWAAMLSTATVATSGFTLATVGATAAIVGITLAVAAAAVGIGLLAVKLSGNGDKIDAFAEKYIGAMERMKAAELESDRQTLLQKGNEWYATKEKWINKNNDAIIEHIQYLKDYSKVEDEVAQREIKNLEKILKIRKNNELKPGPFRDQTFEEIKNKTFDQRAEAKSNLADLKTAGMKKKLEEQIADRRKKIAYDRMSDEEKLITLEKKRLLLINKTQTGGTIGRLNAKKDLIEVNDQIFNLTDKDKDKDITTGGNKQVARAVIKGSVEDAQLKAQIKLDERNFEVQKQQLKTGEEVAKNTKKTADALKNTTPTSIIVEEAI